MRLRIPWRQCHAHNIRNIENEGKFIFNPQSFPRYQEGWMKTWLFLLTSVQEYQRYFHKTKEKLETTPSERQFDFSEMYIFGKFDTFQRRLNKILEMFSTVSTYSALQDSKIEGLETFATRFQVGILFDQMVDVLWNEMTLLPFTDLLTCQGGRGFHGRLPQWWKPAVHLFVLYIHGKYWWKCYFRVWTLWNVSWKIAIDLDSLCLIGV